MRFTSYGVVLAMLLGAGSWFVWAAAPPSDNDDPAQRDYSGQLPRVPAVEPRQALDTFTVLPGFRVELAASEPQMTDPVAIAFDEQGRLFVCEMRDYSEQADDFLGVIRLLEDRDGNGHYETSTVYADGLSWPTALICWKGGLFVGAPPDIWYLKDTTGDGRADERRKVFTGFGRTNVQGLLNSFTWGLDNRIHGAASSSGGEITRVDQPDAQPVGVRSRDFAFNPHTLDFVATSGGAQHGLSFDDWGNKFLCSNSNHIQQVMYDDRYASANPYLTPKSPRATIAADGPAAEVYRTSPVEAWRVIRTELRVSGAVPGAVEGGGRAAGYFTGATGVMIYRGDASPQLDGMAVVGDAGGNLVHRKRIEMAGIEFVADRVDEHSELLSSRDIWFRPVQFANGPDGALYVCDMYREVIEHPNSLPEILKKHLDLTSGRDRGRIWRVVPENFQRRPLPKLGEATTAELVATLEHPNAWHRETAARLLYERQDSAAVAPLRSLAADSRSPQGRLHAIYALDGLGALDAATLIARLDDGHPWVRRHAVRLAEPLLADEPALVDKLLLMPNDDDVHVRYQVAFTLGSVDDPRRLDALEQLALGTAGDAWLQFALLCSLPRDSGEMLRRLAARPDFRNSSAGSALLGQLAAVAGRRNDANEVQTVLHVLETLPVAEPAAASAIVRELLPAIRRAGGSVRATAGPRLESLLASLIQRARAVAPDAQARLNQRIEAVRTLGFAPLDEVRGELAGLLDHRQPQELQQAVVATLGQYGTPEVTDVLLATWPTLSPRLRNTAVEAMFSRPALLAGLLDAIEQGRFNPADLDPARIVMLTTHRDRDLQRRAQLLLGNVRSGRRDDVVQAYRDVLELSGDAIRGKEHFKRVCAACHRLEGVGVELGANLMAMQNRGREAILLNLLDPNREVNPQYTNYVVITTDGRSLTGMITAESASTITLTRAENAQDTVARNEIDELVSTGLSIMPEGLEKQLDRQALADVIEYLMTVK